VVKRQGLSLAMASLAAALACASGCSQVLGLDSYGPAGEDAGADATLDAVTADRTIDSGTAESQPPGEAAGDDGSVADAPPATDSAGGFDAADGQNEASPTDASDASDAPPFDAGACSGGGACAPPIPPGWTGPLVLWEGSGNAPTCGSGFDPVFDGGASPPTANANCTCGCESPTGVTCGTPVLTFNNKNTCHGMNCGMVSLPQGACTDVGGTGGACSNVSASGATASGGSCAPDASTSLPQWNWGTFAKACMPSALPDAGCGAGGQCIPPLPASFEGHVCILNQGTGGCPAGDYSVARVYYGGAQDTRGCSSCTCGSPPSGADCNANAKVVLWATPGCDGGATLELSPLPSSCATPAFKTQGATFTTTATGGRCTPVGGGPTGGIVPQGPVTICCTP
jgi:hypothetical protein